MRLIGLAVILAVGLILAPLVADADHGGNTRHPHMRKMSHIRG